MNFKVISILLVVAACAGCKPNGIPRPDAPLCTVENGVGKCTNSAGDFDIDASLLMCTDIDGYSTLEKHIDELEKEVIRLRRRCNSNR
jgi:hypothetical protein